jgi:flavin reductase (DIM6/NTAB) family NADH-FMN oxidoreductase RutF
LNGIAVREDDPRMLADAVGWMTVRTIDEVRTGDHTFFVGEVLSLEQGPSPTSLVYFNREYQGL